MNAILGLMMIAGLPSTIPMRCLALTGEPYRQCRFLSLRRELLDDQCSNTSMLDRSSPCSIDRAMDLEVAILDGILRASRKRNYCDVENPR